MISSLESQIEDLHKFVGNSLVQHSNLIETIRSLSSSTQPSDTYLKALDSIINLVEMKHSEKVEKELKESLDILDNESPGLLLRLASTLESIPASIIANFATPWVQSLILTFPK